MRLTQTLRSIAEFGYSENNQKRGSVLECGDREARRKSSCLGGTALIEVSEFPSILTCS